MSAADPDFPTAPPEISNQANPANLDQSSWSRFTQSLTNFSQNLPADEGATSAPAVLIQAAKPLVSSQNLQPHSLLSRLRSALSHKYPIASTQPPWLQISKTAAGVKLEIPFLDAHKHYLLAPENRQTLAALGWKTQAEALTCTLSPTAAPRMSTRVLIEVFNIAHPADLIIKYADI